RIVRQEENRRAAKRDLVFIWLVFTFCTNCAGMQQNRSQAGEIRRREGGAKKRVAVTPGAKGGQPSRSRNGKRAIDAADRNPDRHFPDSRFHRLTTEQTWVSFAPLCGIPRVPVASNFATAGCDGHARDDWRETPAAGLRRPVPSFPRTVC